LHVRENAVRKPRDDLNGGTARTDTEADLAQALADRDRNRADLDAANEALDRGRAREAVLVSEIQHRVRNTLAIVRSIFSRTVDNADSLDHAADHFRGRLDTIARYQLREMSPAGFDLENMVRDALLMYAVVDDPRVEIRGPQVALNLRAAETIGLVLHELATNSIKFGILSPSYERGALHLYWATEDDTLSFEWNESGIVVVAIAPLRSGFGREYAEQAIPYQLGGESMLDIGPGYLRCAFSIPMAGNITVQEPLGRQGVVKE
jgi:two-component sensor histidine kinase